MFKSIQCVIAVLGLSVVLTALGADEPYAENGRIEIFGDRYAETRLVNASQGRFIFFRVETPQDKSRGVITVLVNEQYHASLRPGTFSTLCTGQAAHALAAVKREIGTGKKSRLPVQMGIQAQLQAGRTRYFRLMDTSTGEKLLEQEPAEAQPLLKNTREAIHTISRVKGGQICDEERVQQERAQEEQAKPLAAAAVSPSLPPARLTEPAKPLAVTRATEDVKTTVSQFSFSADTLFAFGKASRESMPLQGLHSLDELKARLAREYSGITQIRVIGYADPIGNELANMQLSQMRADEVKNYLRSIGLVNVLILSEGRGSSELVANHCPITPNPVAIQCHQPNRRVVIEVTGMREITPKSR